MKEFFYYFFTAFEGALVLIFLSKELMNKLIRRERNYYEEGEIQEVMEMLSKANLTKSAGDRMPENGGCK